MKLIGRLYRLWTLLLAAGLCLVLAAGSAWAAAAIDPDRSGTLTVQFGPEGGGFAGVAFSVYRVADLSASGAFADYPVSLDQHTASDWRALAQTLDGYAARDGLAPHAAGRTDERGQVRFEQLAPGLYLVRGERYTGGDGTVYTPEPMLVSLPGAGEDGGWVYEVEAACKYDEQPPGGTVTRKVLKVWQDDGNEDRRPDSILVQLLRDGQVVETVELSQANNWQFTWEELDAGAHWQVVEFPAPEGYTVTVEREGITFVMTNTYPGDQPPPPSQPPDKPPELPQTGQLWWPVWPLAGGGALLVLAGLILRRRGERHER